MLNYFELVCMFLFIFLQNQRLNELVNEFLSQLRIIYESESLLIMVKYGGLPYEFIIHKVVKHNLAIRNCV